MWKLAFGEQIVGKTQVVEWFFKPRYVVISVEDDTHLISKQMKP